MGDVKGHVSGAAIRMLSVCGSISAVALIHADVSAAPSQTSCTGSCTLGRGDTLSINIDGNGTPDIEIEYVGAYPYPMKLKRSGNQSLSVLVQPGTCTVKSYPCDATTVTSGFPVAPPHVHKFTSPGSHVPPVPAGDHLDPSSPKAATGTLITTTATHPFTGLTLGPHFDGNLHCTGTCTAPVVTTGCETAPGGDKCVANAALTVCSGTCVTGAVPASCETATGGDACSTASWKGYCSNSAVGNGTETCSTYLRFPSAAEDAQAAELRFEIGGNTHQAWVWLTYDQAGQSYTVHGWGYETVADTYNDLPSPPTLVELQSFAAQAQGGLVLLLWETAAEIDNAGFNIVRSDTAEGPYQQLTTSIIPALGNSVSGASYEWKDVTSEPGKTYYYKLEDIDTRGNSTYHGPVFVTVEASTKTWGAPAEAAASVAGSAPAAASDACNIFLLFLPPAATILWWMRRQRKKKAVKS